MSLCEGCASILNTELLMYSCFVVGVGVGEATVVSSHCGNQPKEVHAPQVSSYGIQDFVYNIIFCLILG